MSLSVNYPVMRPTLNLNFARARQLDPRITFTRASTATYFDSSGVLQTAVAGQPRFDFSPTTLQSLGLLIEEQRTNSLPNNTMQGVVAGNSGTAPTGWTVTGLSNSIARTIVGTGTENGITYIELNYAGTASGDGNITIISSSTTAITASTGQTWTGSVYLRIVGGSLSNLSTPQITLGGRSSAGSLLEATNVSLSSLTSAPLNSQRFIATRTLSSASTERVTITVFNASYVNGAAIDITLRIGLPQLELGAFATSVIPTTTAAATRNADVATMTGTGFSSWYNATEGTLFSEFSSFRPADSANAFAYDINENSTNYTAVRTAAGYTPDRIFPAVVVGGSAQFTGEGTVTTGYLSMPVGSVKNALAYKTNDFAASWNGVTPLVDTSGTLPTPVSLFVGVNGSQNAFLNGHIRRIAYYPVRLSNDQLQALTR